MEDLPLMVRVTSTLASGPSTSNREGMTAGQMSCQLKAEHKSRSLDSFLAVEARVPPLADSKLIKHVDDLLVRLMFLTVSPTPDKT